MEGKVSYNFGEITSRQSALMVLGFFVSPVFVMIVWIVQPALLGDLQMPVRSIITPVSLTVLAPFLIAKYIQDCSPYFAHGLKNGAKIIGLPMALFPLLLSLFVNY